MDCLKIARTTVLSMLFVAWAGPARADQFDEASKVISFQARLTNENGNGPLPGTSVDLVFRIYNLNDDVVETIDLPDQPMDNGVVSVLVPVPSSAFDGTARELGVTVNAGDELSPRIRIAAVPHAYRVDRVASPELDDQITLGETGAAGSLTINGIGDRPSILADGAADRIDIFAQMFNENVVRASLSGRQGPFGGGLLETFGLQGAPTATLGTRLNGSGGYFRLYNRLGDATVQASGTFGDAGVLRLYTEDPQDDPAIVLEARQNGGGDGAFVALTNGSSETIRLDGNDGDGGSRITLRNEAQRETVRLDSCGGDDLSLSGGGGGGTDIPRFDFQDCGGAILVFDGQGRKSIELDGDEQGNAIVRVGVVGGRDPNAPVPAGRGAVFVYDRLGRRSIEIDGDENGDAVVRVGAAGTDDGFVRLYSQSYAQHPTIGLKGDSGAIYAGWAGTSSGSLWLYSEDGVDGDGPTIHLNGQNGWATVNTLTIRGGADLAEPFDVTTTDDDAPEPGTVVSIDPDRPGKLRVSQRAYDRTVAGIISGAGGVRPGMVMGQDGSIANGKHAVALTGRVYCRADATGGPIRPGDLLTTSATPGFAMKVTDHAKSQGAILGKAMTPLPAGRGLVLVLVSLQ